MQKVSERDWSCDIMVTAETLFTDMNNKIYSNIQVNPQNRFYPDSHGVVPYRHQRVSIGDFWSFFNFNKISRFAQTKSKN